MRRRLRAHVWGLVPAKGNPGWYRFRYQGRIGRWVRKVLG